MKMKFYTAIWLLIFAAVGLEYYFLNFNPSRSVLLLLQAKGVLRDSLKISPDPGRPVSLWLGWLGLGIMIIMNLYSMRKRMGFMQSWGKLSSWLNFHVFCGLVGPTFILFHCNFKVRGIVGISFWSMVVSFSSGIIGRYFYVQMMKAKSDFEKEAEKGTQYLRKVLDKNKVPFEEEELVHCLNQAQNFVGVPKNVENLNPVSAFLSSSFGDIRLMFAQPATPQGWPVVTKMVVSEIAVQQRRALLLESFQRLMGYWHTFHFPFAIFMYLAAVIHVAAALVFGI